MFQNTMRIKLLKNLKNIKVREMLQKRQQKRQQMQNGHGSRLYEYEDKSKWNLTL